MHGAGFDLHRNLGYIKPRRRFAQIKSLATNEVAEMRSRQKDNRHWQLLL
jgi:hypothetical protein